MININYIKEILISGPTYVINHFNLSRFLTKNIVKFDYVYTTVEQYEKVITRISTHKEAALRKYYD
jgi:hypothetical protein